nr:MAG TPA_asm: Nuclear receptor-interacting protein 1 repression 3 [Caudoviricetes sp.]
MRTFMIKTIHVSFARNGLLFRFLIFRDMK